MAPCFFCARAYRHTLLPQSPGRVKQYRVYTLITRYFTSN